MPCPVYMLRSGETGCRGLVQGVPVARRLPRGQEEDVVETRRQQSHVQRSDDLLNPATHARGDVAGRHDCYCTIRYDTRCHFNESQHESA